MQVLSQQIAGAIEKSSWIRRMFETGIELKAKFGADNVYDFSLGNPDLPPPPAVPEALIEIAGPSTSRLPWATCPMAAIPMCAPSWLRNWPRSRSVN
ncbi:MAG: hypothetical protein HN849_12135 [Victivallales bacterium]|nr:hypothetical protein [Victivallales bacterium]